MYDEFSSPNAFRRLGSTMTSSLDKVHRGSSTNSFLKYLEGDLSPFQRRSFDGCGMCRSHCWTVDESRQFISIWRNRSCVLDHYPGPLSSCQRRVEAGPVVLPIPSALRSSSDGRLPCMFSSKVSDRDESIAFCTSSGLVCSLDNKISFQLLALPSDRENRIVREVSSFTCSLRQTGDGATPVVVTAIGTTEGDINIDVKVDGRHHHCEAVIDFSSPGNNSDDDVSTISTSNEESCLNEGKSSSSAKQSRSHGSWWSVVLNSILPSYRHQSGDTEEATKGFSSPGFPSARKGKAAMRCDARPTSGSISCHIVCLREKACSPTSSSSCCCLELVCATPIGMGLYKIDVSKQFFRAPSSHRITVTKKWQVNLVEKLKRPGRILGLGENLHTIAVLFISDPTSCALPSLFVALIHAANGKVEQYVRLNAAPGVVNTAMSVPPSQVNVFLAKLKEKEVGICFRDIVLRINFCRDAQRQCSERVILLSRHGSSRDTPCFLLTSYIMDNGDVISLSSRGPRWEIRNVWNSEVMASDALPAGEESSSLLGNPEDPPKAPFTWSFVSSQMEADECVASLFARSAADPTLSLDTLILEKGNSCYSLPSLSDGDRLGVEHLQDEAKYSLRGVTVLLRHRQQDHRRLLMGVLGHKTVVSSLQHETLGQLFSAQESLLVLSSLRALQGISCTLSERDHSSSPLQKMELSFSDPQSAAEVGVPAHGRSSSMHSTVLLLHRAQHVMMAQSILRQCVLRVAEKHQADLSSDTPAAAAHLIFSHPKFASELLEAVVQFLEETWKSATVRMEDKLLTSYAVSCIFVVAAQTMLESRDDVARTYLFSIHVRRHFLWTNSSTALWSIKDLLSHVCQVLSDIWAQACSQPSFFICQESQSDVVEHLHFLLFFLFSCQKDSLNAQAFFSKLLRKTLLRSPFVEEPYGYPHGPPRIGSSFSSPIRVVSTSYGGTVSLPFGLRVIKAAESLALGFDVFDVLADFALSVVINDPTRSNEYSYAASDPLHHSYQAGSASNSVTVGSSSFSSPYALLVEYCKRNNGFFMFALHYLLSQQREWELVSLPGSLFAGIPQAREHRNLFLEKYAPSLLWVTSPTRFDAILRESIAPHPYISYGSDALSHRSRCVALSHLSFIAAGCPTFSTNFGDLELSTEIVKAHKKYFYATSAHEVFGAQELVQRLLALEGNVGAWTDAARIAILTRESLSKDLLMQIFRQCKSCDENIFRTFEESVNEKEASELLFRTATGRVIRNCRPLLSSSLLRDMMSPIYTNEEMQLILSWVDSIFGNKLSTS